MVLSRFLKRHDYVVFEAANLEDARQIVDEHSPELILADFYLGEGTALDLLDDLRAKGTPSSVVVLSGQGSIDLAVQTMQHGAEHFLTKPVPFDTLMVVVERVLKTRQDRRRQLADRTRSKRAELDPFAGTSAAITRLRSLAEAVADSHAPILLLGETGTGKGVLARWFHDHGPRSHEPFVDLNCAGLSKELAESELFGHQRGAFTNATSDKQGMVEVAHRGTLFLDEIGDLDVNVQPKLLKVLEERSFRRVGDVKNKSVDVRLISATHRDLAEMAQTGDFRNDLLFRINVVILELPPLRERTEDLEPLVEQLLQRLSVSTRLKCRGISKRGLEAMKNHHWPGNVRELKNVLERALLFCGDNELNPAEHIVSSSRKSSQPPAPTVSLEEVERQHIQNVVRAHGGRVEAAAGALGLPRSSLYAKMKRYGIQAQ